MDISVRPGDDRKRSVDNPVSSKIPLDQVFCVIESGARSEQRTPNEPPQGTRSEQRDRDRGHRSPAISTESRTSSGRIGERESRRPEQVTATASDPPGRRATVGHGGLSAGTGNRVGRRGRPGTRSVRRSSATELWHGVVREGHPNWPDREIPTGTRSSARATGVTTPGGGGPFDRETGRSDRTNGHRPPRDPSGGSETGDV